MDRLEDFSGFYKLPQSQVLKWNSGLHGEKIHLHYGLKEAHKRSCTHVELYMSSHFDQ
jgi:hypothetical protein